MLSFWPGGSSTSAMLPILLASRRSGSRGGQLTRGEGLAQIVAHRSRQGQQRGEIRASGVTDQRFHHDVAIELGQRGELVVPQPLLTAHAIDLGQALTTVGRGDEGV